MSSPCRVCRPRFVPLALALFLFPFLFPFLFLFPSPRPRRCRPLVRFVLAVLASSRYLAPFIHPTSRGS